MPALLLACHAAMGCLVTEKVKIREERNVPPSISTDSNAPHPLNEVIVLNQDEGDLDGDLEFEVRIRDENVEQRLFFVVLVNDVNNDVVAGEIFASGQSTDAATSGGPLRDPLQFSVPTASFALNACNRVELRVSSDFQRFSSEPVVANDIAKANWWVFPRDTNAVLFDPAQCPNRQQ